MGGDRASKPESGENEFPHGRLDPDRREAGSGIKETEEAHERLASSEVCDRLGLEQVVHERCEHSREGDDEREIANERLATDRNPRVGCVGRRLDTSAPGRRPPAHRDHAAYARNADESQDHQQSAPGEKRRHPLGAHATNEAP